jgi:hypothetical protein
LWLIYLIYLKKIIDKEEQYFAFLINSEAWVNISDKDIRKLEQADKILISKIKV